MGGNDLKWSNGDNLAFSGRLIDALVERGWTQAELSERSGLTRATVNYYVKGKIGPSLRAAMKIAQVLEVSLDWLCGADLGKEEK